MGDANDGRQKAIIGNVDNDFWIFDSEKGFDLTRPSPPTAEPSQDAITVETTTAAITVDPAKSALVVIDMQNFFLSPALGRPAGSKGSKAQDQLLQHALPAARKAGFQIAWVNWGLTDEDLETMPPAVTRAFGFNAMTTDLFHRTYSTASPGSSELPSGTGPYQKDLWKDTEIYKGLGQPLGDVTLPDGSRIPAGRMLMRDQWNSQLTPALLESYEASLKSAKPDVILDKLRMSGLHLPDSASNKYFKQHGIKTLFFAGVNTDQCVNGTLLDAFAQGYDCIMLSDGCATTSPAAAQECVEFNSAKTTGFVVDCEGFAEGVEASVSYRSSQ